MDSQATPFCGRSPISRPPNFHVLCKEQIASAGSPVLDFETLETCRLLPDVQRLENHEGLLLVSRTQQKKWARARCALVGCRKMPAETTALEHQRTCLLRTGLMPANGQHIVHTVLISGSSQKKGTQPYNTGVLKLGNPQKVAFSLSSYITHVTSRLRITPCPSPWLSLCLYHASL